MGLRDLFVVEFRVGAAEDVDPRPVAEPKEQALPLMDPEGGAPRDLGSVPRVAARLVGNAAQEDGTDVVGVGHVDQVGHLRRRAEDQAAFNECVGRAALLDRPELVEPPCEALDEVHPG